MAAPCPSFRTNRKLLPAAPSITFRVVMLRSNDRFLLDPGSRTIFTLHQGLANLQARTRRWVPPGVPPQSPLTLGACRL